MYDITVLVRVSALAIVYAMQVRPTAPAANNNVAKVDHAAGCAKHGEAPGSQWSIGIDDAETLRVLVFHKCVLKEIGHEWTTMIGVGCV